jgi:hypothetical protein
MMVGATDDLLSGLFDSRPAAHVRPDGVGRVPRQVPGLHGGVSLAGIGEATSTAPLLSMLSVVNLLASLHARR